MGAADSGRAGPTASPGPTLPAGQPGARSASASSGPPGPTASPGSPRRRRFWLGWRGLLALFALALVIVVAARLVLENRGVRRLLLDQLNAALARELAVDVTIDDFSLSVLPPFSVADLHLTAVRIGQPGAAPFARADSLTARVDLVALRRGAVHLERLLVDGLAIDLAAPLPTPPPRDTAPTADTPAPRIDHFELVGGSVASGLVRGPVSGSVGGPVSGPAKDPAKDAAAPPTDPPPAGIAPGTGAQDPAPTRQPALAIASWQARAIALSGHLDARTLAIDQLGGELVLESGDVRAPLVATVDTAFDVTLPGLLSDRAGPAAGRYTSAGDPGAALASDPADGATVVTLRKPLTVRGEGVTVDLAGSVSLPADGPPAPGDLHLAADLALARVAPASFTRGRLEAEVRLAAAPIDTGLPAAPLSLDLHLGDLAGADLVALLGNRLDPALARNLGLPSQTLAAHLVAALDPARWNAATAQAELVAERAGRTVLAAEITLASAHDPEPGGGSRLRTTVSAESDQEQPDQGQPGEGQPDERRTAEVAAGEVAASELPPGAIAAGADAQGGLVVRAATGPFAPGPAAPRLLDAALTLLPTTPGLRQARLALTIPALDQLLGSAPGNQAAGDSRTATSAAVAVGSSDRQPAAGGRPLAVGSSPPATPAPTRATRPQAPLTLAAGHLELASDDLAATLDTLHAEWPTWIPAAATQPQVAGGGRVRLDLLPAVSRLDRPVVGGELRWSPPPLAGRSSGTLTVALASLAVDLGELGTTAAAAATPAQTTAPAPARITPTAALGSHAPSLGPTSGPSAASRLPLSGEGTVTFTQLSLASVAGAGERSATGTTSEGLAGQLDGSLHFGTTRDGLALDGEVRGQGLRITPAAISAETTRVAVAGTLRWGAATERSARSTPTSLAASAPSTPAAPPPVPGASQDLGFAGHLDAGIHGLERGTQRIGHLTATLDGDLALAVSNQTASGQTASSSRLSEAGESALSGPAGGSGQAGAAGPSTQSGQPHLSGRPGESSPPDRPWPVRGTAHLRLEATDVVPNGPATADPPTAFSTLETLQLAATLDARQLRLLALEVSDFEGRRVSASGSLPARLPIRRANLAVSGDLGDFGFAADPGAPGAPALGPLAAALALRAGSLQLTAAAPESAGGALSLAARLPLGAVVHALDPGATATDDQRHRGATDPDAANPLTATLTELVGPLASGPPTVTFEAPHVSADRLWSALGIADRPERFAFGIAGALALDLGHPAQSRGEVTISDLWADLPEPVTEEALTEESLAPFTTGDPPEPGLAAATTAGATAPRENGAPLGQSLSEPSSDRPGELTGQLADQLAAYPPGATPPVVHRLIAGTPIQLLLAGDPRAPFLSVAAPDLTLDGRPLVLAGRADLAAGWQPGDDPATLVTGLSARFAGTAEAGLFAPYLGGGIARGQLEIDGEVAGRLDDLAATLDVRGADASLLWVTPYLLTVGDLAARATLGGGTLRLERFTATVNGGTLSATGARNPRGDLALDVSLREVPASLDYGLLAQLGGDLRLAWPADGRGLLAGRLRVDRAVLDRDLDVERDLLLTLLQPPAEAGSAASVLEEIDLDLAIEGGDGVRISNNVAELRANWAAPFRLAGKLAAPRITGTLEVEPGGLIFAYGQVVRLDRATVRYTGNPGTDPAIDAVTTSSLQDPTLTRGSRRPSPLDALDEAPSADGAGQGDLAEGLGLGLAGYYGNRLAATIGRSLGLSEVSLRPVLIFGEAEPSARLTLTRALLPQVSFALSLDLRNAERQTYLLDLHDLRALPSFAGQLFTTDQGEEGVTVQQALELGGSRRRDEQPRLGRLRITFAPAAEPARDATGNPANADPTASATADVAPGRTGHSTAGPPAGEATGESPFGPLALRSLRRALGLSRGAPLPPGSRFDAEVDAVAWLRRHGYPDATATATLVARDRPDQPGDLQVRRANERLDLTLTIAPGQRTEVVFRGDRLPAAVRRSVAALYRGGLFASAARLAMIEQAERELRSRGHLHPRVTVRVSDDGPAAMTRNPAAARRAADPTDGNPTATTPTAATGANPIPAGRGAADPAAGDPAPPAQRGTDDPVRRVEVTIAAGPRVGLERVIVRGVPDEDVAQLAPRLASPLLRAELAIGDPAAWRRVETALAELAYPAAKLLAASLSSDGNELALTMDPGPRDEIVDVAMAAMAATPGDTAAQEAAGLAGSAAAMAAAGEVGVAGTGGPGSTTAGGQSALTLADPTLATALPATRQAAILEQLSLTPGAAPRQGALALATLAFEQELARAGFPAAQVLVEVTAATPAAGDAAGTSERRPVKVRFAVDLGRAVPVGEVTVEGQRHTSPGLLARLVDLDEGAPADPLAIDAARGRLYGSGLFQTVGVVEEPRPDGSLALRFQVVERRRWSVAYGVRWDSDRGASAVVDLADHNLFGRAMTLGARGLWKEEDQSGRLYWQAREILGSQLSLEAFAEVRHRETPDENLVEDWLELTLQASHPFGRAGTLRLYGRNRDTRINELEPDPFFPSFEIQIVNRFLGMQALWDSRDAPLLPTRGWFSSIDLSGSGEALGSDLSYLRLYAQTNHFRTLAPRFGRRVVWGQSYRLGWAEAFSGQDLVRDVRFFAGGDFSVRGYATDSLGPEEDLGTLVRPLGGGVLAILNQELRIEAFEGIWALAFVDAGQIWEDPDALDGDLATAFGLGVRADLPVGVLRFDAAIPFDRRPGDDRYQLHFGFGTTF